MQRWGTREWEVAGPQNPLMGIIAKMQQEAKLMSSLKIRIFVEIVSPFEAFSSLGII